MSGMLKGWSDDDLRNAAQIIGQLPAPMPDPTRALPAQVEKARTLVQQHRCNFCHKPDFSGAENAPRLAGQREDYLLKTLRDYKSNRRVAYDASMVDALHPLTDADLQLLAQYLSQLN